MVRLFTLTKQAYLSKVTQLYRNEKDCRPPTPIFHPNVFIPPPPQYRQPERASTTSSKISAPNPLACFRFKKRKQNAGMKNIITNNKVFSCYPSGKNNQSLLHTRRRRNDQEVQSPILQEESIDLSTTIDYNEPVSFPNNIHNPSPLKNDGKKLSNLNPHAQCFTPSSKSCQPKISPHYKSISPFSPNSFSPKPTSRSSTTKKKEKRLNKQFDTHIILADSYQYQVKIVSQNVQGLKTNSKIDHIISEMKSHDIDVFLAQETWITGDFSKTINGYRMLHHGLSSHCSHRGERGVAIFLSPTATKAYKEANEMPPKKSSSDHTTTTGGRFISIDLIFSGIFKKSKGAFRKKNKKTVTKVNISSIYYPYKEEEYEEMLDLVSDHLQNQSPSKFIIIGQDSNAKVGTQNDQDREEFESNDIHIGQYGEKQRNTKGESLLNLVRSFNLKICNTFFEHPSYSTWKDFREKSSKHQIDHILANQTCFNSITNCKVSQIGTISDHSSLLTTLAIKYKKNHHKKPRKVIKWDKLVNENEKIHFNDQIISTFDGGNLDDFCTALTEAGKASLLEEETTDTGWFHFSRDTLAPILNKRNKVLFEARQQDNSEELRQRCRDARTAAKIAVEAAKCRWNEHLASSIANMKNTPKASWEAIKTLMKGDSSHHIENNPMKFKLKNGKISSNDKETIGVLAEHFHQVYNRKTNVDWNFINSISTKKTFHEISGPMTLDELNEAINKLAWHKAPGRNGLSPNAIKALNDDHRLILLQFLHQWMDNPSLTFDDWQIATVTPLPKKGDLSDPNNWRGITLLDVTSKVVSIFINNRLQRLLKEHGVPYQFGATPSLGCVDAVFTLKTLLQERRERSLDTWVTFIDLVKAYDSIQHRIIQKTLELLGAPFEIIQWTMKLYRNFQVTIKIGKEEVAVPYGCGVKQGDSMAPILFICTIQLAAVEIGRQFEENNIQIPTINISNDCIRPKNYSNTNKNQSITIFILLFMDDGALPFGSREDAIIGTRICIQTLEKFGLVVHTGNDGKRSKTEAMFIPSTITLQRWRHSQPIAITNTSGHANDHTNITLRQSSQVNLDSIYENSVETKTIILDEHNNHIHFVKEFKYLGTIINYMLDDTIDIKHRITQASKAVGALNSLWNSQAVSIETKVKMYLAIPVNLLLWNSESWSGNSTDLQQIDVFHHKTIRRILGINMADVKEHHITNESIRRQFGNIDLLSTIWRKRVLTFIGRTICQPNTALSKQCLSGSVGGKRIKGRPFRTCKDAFIESIRLLIPSMPHTGNFNYWAGHAQNKPTWSNMIKTLGSKTYKRYQENTSTPPKTSPPSPPKEKRNTNHSSNTKQSQYTSVTSRASALKILQLHNKATKREITLQYRFLARIYHPDKWCELKPFSRNDGAEMFKSIANARDFLLQ